MEDSSSSFVRLRDLFDQVMDREEADRERFLDSVCAGEPELRRAVESLIELDARADGFLGSPFELPPIGDVADTPRATPKEPSDQLSERPLTPFEPDRIGPYRILRRLGQGGMGVVYLALRDDDTFQKRVVVKLVRRDLEDPDLRRRLRAERQILAGLEHPNIARLFDGGTLDGQRPYFVMEHVVGVPIDEYCDQQQLSIDERLRLFHKVCSAVHYAHQNLVIHRDLKPSNILVTAEGEPKLLDFGIAKLINPELASREMHVTSGWKRLMTPQYSSPEQVRGLPTTTASDIYSLGVLLYQILTGHPHFELSGQTPREIERILTEHEPPRPSQSVLKMSTTQAETTAEIARARRLRPRELHRQLAGDLDGIVLKALRSAPQRRYESAARLAADLERFRQGLPVEARRGTFSYLAGKFFVRHRVAVSFASMVAVMVLVGLALLARESARVARQRDQAEVERRQKENILELTRDIFRLADPYVSDGESFTVREALAKSREPLRHRLRDQPEVRAELLQLTGVIQSNLGLLQQARADLGNAIALRRELGQPRQLAESLAHLGVALVLSGDTEAALDVSREAVEILRAEGGDDLGLIDALHRRVTVLCLVGDYAAAEPLTEEALRRLRQRPDAELGRLAEALFDRALVENHRGEHLEAVDHYRQSLSLLEQLNGPNHLSLADPLINLGQALRDSQNYNAAEEVYLKALKLQRSALGDDHFYLAAVFNNLAGLYTQRGEWGETKKVLDQALELYRVHQGNDHPRTIFLQIRLASVRLKLDEAGPAADQLRRNLPVWRERLGPDHRFIPLADWVLGEALLALERFDEAETTLLRSLDAYGALNRPADIEKVTKTLVELYRVTQQADKLAGLLNP